MMPNYQEIYGEKLTEPPITNDIWVYFDMTENEWLEELEECIKHLKSA